MIDIFDNFLTHDELEKCDILYSKPSWKFGQVSQTSPTQPAAVSTPTVSPAEVPPITMMADQSISDRIEELFPEDELSKAIARRQQATGAQNA